MKALSRRSWAQVIVVALTLSCGVSMGAAEQGSDYAEIDPNVDVRALSNPDALRVAYGVLYTANHNYNGHRVRAMKEIRNAAAQLGVELAGDGSGHEKQDVSDEGFRLAQR